MRTFIKAASGILLLFCMRPEFAGAADWSSQIVEHDVDPSDTDRDIDRSDSRNVSGYLKDNREDGRLLVFFGGAPSLRRTPTIPFIADALEHHYRVIMIDYVYNPPGTRLCDQSEDPCFSQYRKAKLFGGSPMEGLDVSPAEGLAARTAAMLRYLHRRWPSEHWDRYLDHNQPRWADIAVSGFSQGAGLAAFFAKSTPVARVILLSSPWDHYQDTGTIASWLSASSATPADRWWGMYSAHETNAPWMQKTYAALGIPPDHIRLVTDAAQCKPGSGNYMPNHWSVAELGCTPRTSDGQFMEKPLWDLMLGDGDLKNQENTR
ncbi:BPSS1187 family protein [Gluconacetobacter sp. Hr-1-5]|uniref:BPSS1187 family protein n=1 Tax=Gluconacetobacter sp. Hr-1-5 TaxID=3395370 RepID=UPI003B5291C8